MPLFELARQDKSVNGASELLLPYDALANRDSDSGKYYRFTLSGLKAKITSVMTNELAIGGSNTFSAKTELQERIPVVGKITEVTNKIKVVPQLANSASYTKNETSNTWTQSGKPQFTVDFTLIANNADKAKTHVDWIKMLQSAVLPQGSHDGGLAPPNGYTNTGAGTLTLFVGAWFKATSLVMVNTTFTPSKQVMSNGYPLFWVCSITLEPYRMITAGDFSKYFSQPQTMSVDEVQIVKKNDPNFFESFVAKVNDQKKKLLG